jgi:hypothetical protein
MSFRLVHSTLKTERKKNKYEVSSLLGYDVVSTGNHWPACCENLRSRKSKYHSRHHFHRFMEIYIREMLTFLGDVEVSPASSQWQFHCTLPCAAVSSLSRSHNFSLSEEQASPLSQKLRYGETGELDRGMPLKCYGPSLVTWANCEN